MSARDELNSYLAALRQRLRWQALSRGGAIVVAVALLMTLALVLLMRALLFSSSAITLSRLLLYVTLPISIALAVVLPLWRLTRARAAVDAERRFPQFQQRLQTFLERDGNDPFLELLASDTLALTGGLPPERIAPKRAMTWWLTAAAAAAVALLWLIAAAPGPLGYGAHLLWLHSARGQPPRYGIAVDPGNVSIRRHSDQLISARPVGIRARELVLFAHYQSGAGWERLPMQEHGDGAYQAVLTAVPENVEYYVQAGGRSSPRFSIRALDPPAIEHIRIVYHFPAWTGLKEQVQEQGGDLRALQGTDADLEITTDRPMTQGLLVLDDGQQVRLQPGSGNRYQGTIRLQHDGSYHVAALEGTAPLRLSDDFFIEARKAAAPTVSITRPGGDYRASPIEEITVTVHASDEFGLQQLELHYSVNGEAERSVPLLQRSGDQQITASSVLALENYKLVPGDVISLYAVARDAQLESRTDMGFIQTEPFEREFSQSQATGGGAGGGGDESAEISQREKEIIAATFKQLHAGADAKQSADSAKFLFDVQTTLRNQSLALAGRLRSRELSAQNSEFSRFQQEMTAAAAAMTPSAQQLQQQQWQGAIPEEQKALQHLLRAEASFREIEIAYASRGGGGGAGRDLASLFDLELDTEKNQYEAQQTASSADQRAREIDEALKKLDELARRQEALAQSQQQQGSRPAEQRWEQELLRREAEQLQQQLQQLAQSQQGPGGPGGDQSGSAAAGAQARGQSTRQAAQQTLEQLREAEQAMQRSADGADAGDGRLAAQRLREARNALGGAQSQQSAQRMETIAGEAQRLAEQQATQRDRIARLNDRTSASAASARELERLIGDRQRLVDSLNALQQNMRNAARELSAQQRAAAEQLRAALKDLDDSDLEPLLQRSADRMRSGLSASTRQSEDDIATGLQRLAQQTQQARQALTAGPGAPGTDDTQAALERVAELRAQIDALSNAPLRDTRPGGGMGADGFVANNIDTGDNGRPGQSARPLPGSEASRPDRQARIEQGLGELQALRGSARGDPETQRQVQQLIADMQHLDLRRFPGNPAMIEHIHQQLLGELDTLELQLRRRLEQQQPPIRGADPQLVPRGYESEVADYFRHLSAGSAD
jgi:hypothetical protein